MHTLIYNTPYSPKNTLINAFGACKYRTFVRVQLIINQNNNLMETTILFQAGNEQNDIDFTSPCAKNTIHFEAPYLHEISDIQISVNTNFDNLMSEIIEQIKEYESLSYNTKTGIVYCYIKNKKYAIRESNNKLGIISKHKILDNNIISSPLGKPIEYIDFFNEYSSNLIKEYCT